MLIFLILSLSKREKYSSSSQNALRTIAYVYKAILKPLSAAVFMNARPSSSNPYKKKYWTPLRYSIEGLRCAKHSSYNLKGLGISLLPIGIPMADSSLLSLPDELQEKVVQNVARGSITDLAAVKLTCKQLKEVSE
ncbi:hypothetical protein Bca4012_026363 [Brassica carinata]